MREIKFRGFYKEAKSFIYSDDYDFIDLDDNCFCDIIEGTPIRTYTEDLQQFTGLKDKNGLTDIYEDDIINSEGLVIGNKYQNYELLKESTNFLIQGFGTEDWETTNKKAMERGCKYSKRYADKNEF